MKLGLLVLMPLAASCASSSGAPEPSADAGPDAPPPPQEDAAAASDAAAPDAVTTQQAPGVGSCAACTAQICTNDLRGCAAEQACVDGLVAFNDCYGRTSDGRSCGKTFASKSPRANALWTCMDKSCTTPCEG